MANKEKARELFGMYDGLEVLEEIKSTARTTDGEGQEASIKEDPDVIKDSSYSTSKSFDIQEEGPFYVKARANVRGGSTDGKVHWGFASRNELLAVLDSPATWTEIDTGWIGPVWPKEGKIELEFGLPMYGDRPQSGYVEWVNLSYLESKTGINVIHYSML